MKNETTTNTFSTFKPLTNRWLKRTSTFSLHYLSLQSEPLAYLAGLALLKLGTSLMTKLRSLATQASQWLSMAFRTVKSKSKSLTVQLLQCFVHAFKDLVAGLDARLTALRTNKRLLVGYVLMFGLCPASYCTYLLFRGTPKIDDWFHLNLFHFFFLIRWQMSFLIGALGLYHYAGEDRKWKILALPMGFVFMSLVVNVMADNNEEIWAVGDLVLWGAGIALSLLIFYGLDYAVWRKFHGQDSFPRRIKGLCQIADDVPAEKWKSMMLTVLREQEEFERTK